MNVFGYMGSILVSNDKGLGTTKWPILHTQPLQQIIICLRVLEGSVLSLGTPHISTWQWKSTHPLSAPTPCEGKLRYSYHRGSESSLERKQVTNVDSGL